MKMVFLLLMMNKMLAKQENSLSYW